MSGPIRGILTPHLPSKRTTMAVAHSRIDRLGLVVKGRQIGVDPNRFITFQKGGDYSGACRVFSSILFSIYERTHVTLELVF